MKTDQGAAGLADKKPRRNQLAPDEEYAGIKLSRKTKARMRIIAASRHISFATFSSEIIALGLSEYLKGGHLDLGALEAMETAAAVSAAREATA